MIVVDLPFQASIGLSTAAPALVDASGSPITATGNGLTDQVVVAPDGGLTYNTGGGSGSIVAGDQDSVAGSSQIVIPTVGGGQFSIRLGDGDNSVLAGSGNNAIATGHGHNFIGLGSGTDQITDTGEDTVIGGAGDATVNAAAGNVLATAQRGT